MPQTADLPSAPRVVAQHLRPEQAPVAVAAAADVKLDLCRLAGSRFGRLAARGRERRVCAERNAKLSIVQQSGVTMKRLHNGCDAAILRRQP
eukprot:734865-Prymnesium_polylepis.1